MLTMHALHLSMKKQQRSWYVESAQSLHAMTSESLNTTFLLALLLTGPCFASGPHFRCGYH